MRLYSHWLSKDLRPLRAFPRIKGYDLRTQIESHRQMSFHLGRSATSRFYENPQGVLQVVLHTDSCCSSTRCCEIHVKPFRRDRRVLNPMMHCFTLDACIGILSRYRRHRTVTLSAYSISQSLQGEICWTQVSFDATAPRRYERSWLGFGDRRMRRLCT